MAKSRLAKANVEIAEKVVGGYKAVEEGAVGAYKAVEEGVVGAYRGIESAFVEQFLTHDGESVEDAKARLCAEREERQGQDDGHEAQGGDYTRRAREAAHLPERQTEAN